MDVKEVFAPLDDEQGRADTTLRGKSLQRALQGKVPTTLTPHEWEQWYAQHGVPAEHRARTEPAHRPWWRFWQSRG